MQPRMRDLSAEANERQQEVAAGRAMGKGWSARHTVLATAGLALFLVVFAFAVYFFVYR